MNMIIRGSLKAGDRLPPERELAKDLAIGRSSLREALKHLFMMGVLESRPGSGTYVRRLSPEIVSRPLHWEILIGGRNFEALP